jgi:hypothetical protein
MSETPFAWKIQFLQREEQFALMRRWHEQAISLGLAEAYVRSLRTILTTLASDPEAFGDPSYNAHAAGYVVYHRLLFPLQVWYAVHPLARVVWIQRIRPQDGLGFSEG